MRDLHSGSASQLQNHSVDQHMRQAILDAADASPSDNVCVCVCRVCMLCVCAVCMCVCDVCVVYVCAVCNMCVCGV